LNINYYLLSRATAFSRDPKIVRILSFDFPLLPNLLYIYPCMSHVHDRWHHEQSSWEKRPCSSCLACAMGEIAGTTSRARGREAAMFLHALLKTLT
jgi:hypothetical protein